MNRDESLVREVGQLQCPTCGGAMADITERWGTFEEARGAEYLASYVTIWHCSHCNTLAGTDVEGIEWVMDGETAPDR